MVRSQLAEILVRALFHSYLEMQCGKYKLFSYQENFVQKQAENRKIMFSSRFYISLYF